MVSGNYGSWTAFLETAARLYKYPYHEQLMIYAQRPDATACAEYDLWNQRMGRYVRRGSKGIALIDNSGEKPRIKYVFDVADTVGTERSRSPYLWKYRPEHEVAVSTALEGTYNVAASDGFGEQLNQVAAVLVAQYWLDHQQDILRIVDGSHLERYHDYDKGVTFINAATVSTAYTLMARCGLETPFGYEDFQPVLDFNTPETVAALGSAVSQISETVLRQIEVTIKQYEREKITERSQNYERTDLQQERGLLHSQPDPVPAEREAPGQVWSDAESISSGASSGAVEQPDPVGEIVSPSVGDRGNSEPAVGADAAEADAVGRGDGGTESGRSHEMGGADEQPESPGRGNDSGRADLQLTEEPPVTGEQFSFFLSEAEQIQYIAEAERASVAPSAFSMPQETIDHFLRLGSNTDNHRTRILLEYAKEQPTEKLVAFLQKTYHGGNGLEIEGSKVSAWYGKDGIRLAYGSSARYARNAQVLSWEDVVARIGVLLEQGQFATNVEVAESRSFEQKQLARELWYMTRDMGREAIDAGYMRAVRSLRGGFPEETQQIAAMLASPKEYAAILDQLYTFRDAWLENNSLMRFRFYSPQKLIAPMEDYARPRREYTSSMAEVPSVQGFITEDEINEALAGGSHVEGSKARIYDFYQKSPSAREQADFLKQEYGIGGGNCALSHCFYSDVSHDSKGIRYKKPNCYNVELSWPKVAKTIDTLIHSGRFYSPEQLARKEALEAEKAAAKNVEAIPEVEAPIPEEPKQAEEVPSIWDYNPIKEAHPEDIVLYQVGDFFEMYGVDARKAANLLNLTLTTRPIPTGGRVDMCGIPAHTLEQSVEKLRQQFPVTISALGENGGRNTYPLEKAAPSAPSATVSNLAETIASVGPFYEDYREIKKIHPEDLVLVKLNDGYFAFEKDADTVARELHLETAKRDVIGRNRPVTVCFLPVEHFAEQFDALTRKGYGSILVDHDPNKGLETFTILPGEEAQRGAPGTEAATTEPLTPVEIDELLAQWNGDIASKQRVVDYMAEHRQEHDAARWLAEEYGASVEKPLMFGKAGSTSADVVMPWPQVQQRIVQMIQSGDFLLPQETDPNTQDYAKEYRLLNRLRADCEYFLGEGNQQERHLWAENVYKQIHKMRELYNTLPEKPDWLAMEQIDSYAAKMSHRYLVVTYHHIENGFDDKLDYHTLEEAEKAAQGYVDGTMESDGFAYDGAAIYDLREEKWLHIYGDFPDPRAQEQLFPAKPISWEPEKEENLPYKVGDSVYLDNTAFEITEIGRFDVQLRDSKLLYPIFRSESKERLLQLMQHDDRNRAILDSAEPKPPAPTMEEATDQNPISVQVGGQWQTFPNTAAAEEAIYADFKAATHRNAQNFRITDEELGVGGAKAKFEGNINAIRLLKTLEAEGMQASPEQQEILSRYVGWGGLPDAFDPEKPNWATEYQQLKELLTPKEYEAARASTLNAHYTSPTVIRAIYEAVENMGFQTGNILEPSMGVGNFFGMLPESMQNSRLYGVELDSITGRIAKQLYPKANITVAGFETTDRRDFFDLAIGNVPFGQYKVNDPAYNKLGFNIHNYFFAKALDQVRPGGVVAFVTSRYTMDAKNPEVRKYLAQRADLLGAIRLPNNAFKANAGTEVVSDIIFLQKKDRPIEIDPDWVHLGETEDGYAINQYFLDHPEMVMGRNSSESTAHGMDYTVEPLEDVLLSDQLQQAVRHIQGTYREAELPDLGEGEEIRSSLPADPDIKNYSYTLVDGEVYYRENSIMVKPELNATAKERVKGMVQLKNCVSDLIAAQMSETVPDTVIREHQEKLNRLYDDYIAKYGIINNRANRLAFSDDSAYYLLCALEILDDEGNFLRKADMFSKRTIQPHRAVTSVDTASEALTLSIAEKACVDLEYMASLMGGSEKIPQIVEDLKGVIYKDPNTGPFDLDTGGSSWALGWQTSDEYLSGNVRQKLREAQQAAGVDPFFSSNVEALIAAQPKDLEAHEIEVRLGATWIDKSYIKQFMVETLDTPFYLQRILDVQYSPYTAAWNIQNKSKISYNDVAAYSTYGTQRVSAYEILEDSLNLRDVRVYDTIEDVDGNKKRILNSTETTLAQQKQQVLREAFRDWVWADPQRRETLVKQYNEEMNCIRPREYDGSHIVFAGMNPEITLREHQRNAIAHTLYGGNTLLAHEVGAGKTFEMVAAAMESKRLGLCRKSIFVVPNHLTEQWASEFLRLYPSANILVTKQRDFETANRKKFCARIATGDYDAVIIGHSQFEKIPISKARQEQQLQDQIAEITMGISELKYNRGEKFSVKELERTKRGLESRLEKLRADTRKDDVVTFEELGVDRLFVDEAHNYKNLFLYTKMQNVAGLSTSDAQKSSDMFAKCRYMDELTGNRGVIFATGTPVSNSMTELYTMQRYLQYSRLEEMGMTHFDCWASRFGETVTALELAPEGKGYRPRTRFSRFFNLPELMNLFKEVADIKTADQLHLPVPEVEYHNISAKPSEIQKSLVQDLSERAAAIHTGSVSPEQDNMLKITSDGRKLGLDQRLVNPLFPDEPGSKVNLCVENVLQAWKDGEADKLTQLVFCDISTPQAKGKVVSEDGKDLTTAPFTVYDDIRAKLIAKGIPAEQIAFIHDANTDVKKKELFGKVRSGQVRILLGSTSKMGAGTNVRATRS